MMRTRLVWFGIGFSIAGAAISNLIWRDLVIDRSSLSSDMKKRFDALESRVVNLERACQDPSPAPQAED